MAEPPTETRRATYQNVIDAPPNVVAEILRGVLHTHPRPAPRHAVAHSALGIEIGAPFDKGRGGPDARTLEAFAREAGRWALVAAFRGEAEARVPPFDAIAFPLGSLWAD